MNPISSVWDVTTRSEKRTTPGLAPRVGDHLAIFTAGAWWLIMPDMKRMSADVYGSRALSARARAIAASRPIAPTGKPVAGSIRPVPQASGPDSATSNATADEEGRIRWGPVRET